MNSVYARVARSFVLLALLPLFVLSASQAGAAPKEWTLLIFLNGHNNLDEFGAFNINQMENYGSTDKINVVVQWASAGHPTTRRLLVQKDADINAVTSPVVEDMPRVDMGDSKNLIEFVKWGAARYPAEHYFVDVWNHGSGWHRKSRGSAVVRDISHDEFSGNHITTEQLGVAINQAAQAINHRIDIYGSDACLMQMLEVNAEMAASVDVVVASQEVEPADGWPYDLFLRNWIALTDTSAQKVSAALVDAYQEYYSAKSRDVTLSAVDLKYQGEVTQGVALLAQSLSSLTPAELTPIATHLEEIQNFFYSDYSDVSHMVEVFSKYAPAKLLPQLKALGESLNKYIIRSQITGSMEKAKGVSLWLPKYKYELETYGARYEGLSFASKSGWKNTLTKLMAVRP